MAKLDPKMNAPCPNRRTISALVWLLAALPLAALGSDERYVGPRLVAHHSGSLLVHNTKFRYPAEERIAFRTREHLETSAPQFLPLQPAIDAWAARFSIHPALLSAVVGSYFGSAVVAGTPEEMNQVRNLAAGLREVFSAHPEHPLAATLAVTAVGRAFDFTTELKSEFAVPRVSKRPKGAAGPPLFGYFQPPWEIGDTWIGNGAHSDSGGPVRNALDFWAENSRWGADVSDSWVTAMQSGTVRVWSSCSMSVIHPNGWETSYYHLDNIQVEDRQQVRRNDRLANYADNRNQALCNGGFSDGPHVHVALFYEGEAVLADEDLVDFTSFSHHVGSGDYDRNCNRAYYTLTGGDTVCVYRDRLLNDAAALESLLFSNGFE